MMTYLDLVNALISELGINGGTSLTSVTAQNSSREALRVVNMVADADYRIQALHGNWAFLWRQFKDLTQLTYNVVPTPAWSVNQYRMRLMDRSSLVLNPGTITECSPTYTEWREFERLYLRGAIGSVNDNPSAFSVKPNRQIILSSPVQTIPMPVQYECWAQPQRMKSDADISPIVYSQALHTPSSSHTVFAAANNAVVQSWGPPSAAGSRDTDGRIIIVRAKIIYAEIEGATEIMQGALTEWLDLLSDLESSQLPGQENDQSSQADRYEAVTTI